MISIIYRIPRYESPGDDDAPASSLSSWSQRKCNRFMGDARRLSHTRDDDTHMRADDDDNAAIDTQTHCACLLYIYVFGSQVDRIMPINGFYDDDISALARLSV